MSPAIEQVAETVQTLAVVPFGKRRPKSKAGALREKYLAKFQGKSAEECLTALKAQYDAETVHDGKSSEAQALLDAGVDDVLKEWAADKEAVADAMKAELEAARAYRNARAQKMDASNQAKEKRMSLLEAQKKLAMLQVVQMNRGTMEKLKEQRVAAMKAAQEAKRSIKEHLMNERRALEEATRQAWGEKKRKVVTNLEVKESGVRDIEVEIPHEGLSMKTIASERDMEAETIPEEKTIAPEQAPVMDEHFPSQASPVKESKNDVNVRADLPAEEEALRAAGA